MRNVFHLNFYKMMIFNHISALCPKNHAWLCFNPQASIQSSISVWREIILAINAPYFPITLRSIRHQFKDWRKRHHDEWELWNLDLDLRVGLLHVQLCGFLTTSSEEAPNLLYVFLKFPSTMLSRIGTFINASLLSLVPAVLAGLLHGPHVPGCGRAWSRTEGG